MHMSNFSKGLSLTLGSLLTNAFVPLLSQFAMKSFKPLEVAFLISLMNVVYCLCWHAKWSIFQKPLLLKIYIKSAIINAFGIIFLYLSLSYLDPITYAFISVFYVVFTVIISTFILNEGRSPIEMIAIGIGVSGAFLIAYKGTATLPSLIGVTLVLLDTFCFAVANFQVKAASRSLHPVGVLFFNNIFCTLIIGMVIAPGLQRHSSLALHLNPCLGILAASACSFAAVGLVYASFRLLSFRLSGLIRAMKPLISTGVALPFAPATLSGCNWFGALLLFISIVALLSKERKG